MTDRVPPLRRSLLVRRLLVAAVLAAAVVALEVARAYLFQPLHQRGSAQSVLSIPLSLSWLLLVPGNRILDLLMRLTGGLVRAVDPWLVFLVVSFLLYVLVFYAIGSLNRWINRRIDRLATAPVRPEAPDEPPAPRVTRRRVLRGAKGAVTAGVAAAAAYPVLAEPRRLEVSHRGFPLRGLPSSLDGLRLVQLTDIHLGPWTSAARVRHIVERANALEADVIALTGDYVLRSAEYIPQVASALAGLRAKVGIVGVLGNHDWNEDALLMTRELTGIGVRMIDNRRLFLTPGRRLDEGRAEGLCVAGVGDFWNDRQLYDRALGGVPDAVPRLLLSHNPDVAEEREFVSSGYRVDLMLSGHTHGGQVVLPLIGAPVTMSQYGQKYARGLVQGPVCPVFVCRGLGMAMMPLRLGSVPEIAVIEFKSAEV